MNAINFDGFQSTITGYGKHFEYCDDYEVMSKIINIDPSMKKYASKKLLRNNNFLSDCNLLTKKRKHT
jgi:hypothetical protein